MARGKKCPVCGHFTYREWKGEYDKEEWGQGRKLSPDFGHCSYCGFTYEEHIWFPFEEQVKNYKKFLMEKDTRREKH